jgi:hypothetical protein
MRMRGLPPILTTARRLARDVGTVAAAWTASWVVEASLARIGLRDTIRWMERVPAFRATEAHADALERTARAVRRAYRLSPFEGTCLRRSLVEYWLGRCEGLPVQLVIGVKPGESFAAHAWVVPGSTEDVDAFSVILRSRAAPASGAP